ncbi:MAG TPA: GNAT family N-acetyltransferase [Gaiellaceae bacterium]|nr:GNAT family N-acetyltransferase [Gaiellaceae bacterium]
MGSSGVITIRASQPADHERLREVAFASKAHWGYDRGFVRRWAEERTFDDECERWVAEADGEVVAWAALLAGQDGIAVLDDLWVDPASFGRGIGTALFHRVEERARELGARSLEWGSEPNAVGFYEKLGGRFLRDHVSEWGRITPWMGLDL